MDSINKNQPEENRKNFSNKEAAEKIKELADQKSCFFCTAVATGESNGARPMSVQKIDDDATLWFLSPSDSHKNKEIERDPSVKLYFQGSAHSDFLQLNGTA